MRIISNDYRTNLPGAMDAAHGGPANFASAFSAYAVKGGHVWIGLVQRGHEGDETKITEAAKIGKKTYYECSLPHSRYRPYLQLKRKRDPRVWFSEEIGVLRGLIRKERPDVLFLNGYSLYAWLLLEAATQEGLPIVVQHAGISRVEFEQYKHLYSAAGRRAMLQMERDIVAVACAQVFLNDYSRQTFSRIVARVPKNQSVIIPLPYAATYASATVRRSKIQNRKRDGIVIGCVARWDRIKNHFALLRLAREARRQGLDWKFKSVTKIPDTAVQAKFKADYRRLIEVVPPMDRQELAGFYESVDALVLPSHFDVSPTVVMEAALMGKQTLISHGVGWNSEYREAGIGRWVADFTDAAGTARKLERLLREKPSARFKKMLIMKHSPDKVFAAYVQLFNKAIRICA